MAPMANFHTKSKGRVGMSTRKTWAAAIAGALLLAGCAGGAPQQGANAGGEVQINIMGATMRLESMVTGWETMIAEFETANPGVKVNLDLQGEWDEIPQRLSQARMSNKSVDLIRTTGGIIRSTLAPAGAVVDLTDAVKPIEDRFVTGTLDNYRIGDHLWGLPYGETTTSAVFYNKTMFDDLGLKAPSTFDELVAASNTIKEKKGIKNPWIHQGSLVGYWPMWFQETYSQTTKHQQVERVEGWLSGKQSFVTPESVDALGLVHKFFEAGVLTRDSLDT
ncbi:MAG: extracellular solute-binding protein, partial [Propionibacteriaceae bacterium]|nr:extracellular solute-binding protein [Propionibacteriaceae bacterium]